MAGERGQGGGAIWTPGSQFGREELEDINWLGEKSKSVSA